MARYKLRRKSYSEDQDSTQVANEKLQKRNDKLKKTALKTGALAATVGAGVLGYKTADGSKGGIKAVNKAVDSARTRVRNNPNYINNQNIVNLHAQGDTKFTKEDAVDAIKRNDNILNRMTTSAANKAASNYRQNRALAAAGITAAALGGAYVTKKILDSRREKRRLEQSERSVDLKD
jgi:hypothetical protein